MTADVFNTPHSSLHEMVVKEQVQIEVHLQHCCWTLEMLEPWP